MPISPPGTHRHRCPPAGLGGSEGLQAVSLALPPSTHTWEQLLAQGSATLPVAGCQLCGRVELLQGQTLGQDVGLSLRAHVQLGSKHRERGCWHETAGPQPPRFRGQGRKDGGPRARPFTSLCLSFRICKMELIVSLGRLC